MRARERARVCVCVCVCVRARAHVSVCVCACARARVKIKYDLNILDTHLIHLMVSAEQTVVPRETTLPLIAADRKVLELSPIKCGTQPVMTYCEVCRMSLASFFQQHAGSF